MRVLDMKHEAIKNKLLFIIPMILFLVILIIVFTNIDETFFFIGVLILIPLDVGIFILLILPVTIEILNGTISVNTTIRRFVFKVDEIKFVNELRTDTVKSLNLLETSSISGIPKENYNFFNFGFGINKKDIMIIFKEKDCEQLSFLVFTPKNTERFLSDITEQWKISLNQVNNSIDLSNLS
jgi:hypothetical protein